MLKSSTDTVICSRNSEGAFTSSPRSGTKWSPEALKNLVPCMTPCKGVQQGPMSPTDGKITRALSLPAGSCAHLASRFRMQDHRLVAASFEAEHPVRISESSDFVFSGVSGCWGTSHSCCC